MTPRILLLDNYDSFTFNLVETLRRTGAERLDVVKNDQVDLDAVGRYDRIIFSPGPALPKDAPAMFRILERYGHRIPILGVCLGHQAIAEHYGGRLRRLRRPYHGQRVPIAIPETQNGIFRGLPTGLHVGLYHSWETPAKHLPAPLKVTALSSDGVVMAIEHRTDPVMGVQFHPESYMTEHGEKMLKNWLTCW